MLCATLKYLVTDNSFPRNLQSEETSWTHTEARTGSLLSF